MFKGKWKRNTQFLLIFESQKISCCERDVVTNANDFFFFFKFKPGKLETYDFSLYKNGNFQDTTEKIKNDPDGKKRAENQRMEYMVKI